MGKTNNTYILMLSMFFIMIAFITPFINEEYDDNLPEYNTDIFEDDVAQADFTATDVFLFLSALIFWSFGAPVWLNLLILLPLRILWVKLLVDAFRGTGS